MFTFDELMCIICLSITTALLLLLIEKIVKNTKRIKELNNEIVNFNEYIEEHAITVFDTIENNRIVANIRTIQ